MVKGGDGKMAILQSPVKEEFANLLEKSDNQFNDGN